VPPTERVGIDPAGGALAAGGVPGAAPSSTLLGDAPAAAEPAAPVEPAPIAPVTYTDFTLPDGLNKDSPLLGTFAAEAGKLGIPQDQAQALVSAVGAKMAELASAGGEAQAAAQLAVWASTNEAWQAEIRADPEIGGAKFEAMKTNVARLFDDYVGPVNSPERKALNEALLRTGAGNNPALVRAFARIAAAHTEGGFVSGAPARGVADIATLMYPSMSRPS
jgi:hypothetical protein